MKNKKKWLKLNKSFSLFIYSFMLILGITGCIYSVFHFMSAHHNIDLAYNVLDMSNDGWFNEEIKYENIADSIDDGITYHNMSYWYMKSMSWIIDYFILGMISAFVIGISLVKLTSWIEYKEEL